MLKNKIFKYFLSEFFLIFLTVSTLFSILIWMTQAARLLELITEFGNPVSIYLKYIFLRFPKIYEDTFLISFAVSIFFLFSKFENSKEINIFYLSGINKIQIYKSCILFSCVLFVFYIFLSIFVSPLSSFKGRQVLGKSEFNLINSLVKEGNFNSPLEGLTIFVNKNDEKGNLDGIFIYEENRTIIAKKGKVISNETGYYLELINGVTQEKIDDKLNIIKFESTIFNFSKFSLRNTTYPKFAERDIFWIYLNMNNMSFKYDEIRQEFNRRVIKPFFIFVICAVSSFLLFSNNEKFNIKKFKYLIYLSSFILIIFNQIALGLSGKYYYGWALYFFIITLIFTFLNIFLPRIINSETLKK
jgi:lipopolysaccharide export system permease protein